MTCKWLSDIVKAVLTKFIKWRTTTTTVARARDNDGLPDRLETNKREKYYCDSKYFLEKEKKLKKFGKDINSLSQSGQVIINLD